MQKGHSYDRNRITKFNSHVHGRSVGGQWDGGQSSRPRFWYNVRKSDQPLLLLHGGRSADIRRWICRRGDLLEHDLRRAGREAGFERQSPVAKTVSILSRRFAGLCTEADLGWGVRLGRRASKLQRQRLCHCRQAGFKREHPVAADLRRRRERSGHPPDDRRRIYSRRSYSYYYRDESGAVYDRRRLDRQAGLLRERTVAKSSELLAERHDQFRNSNGGRWLRSHWISQCKCFCCKVRC